VTPAIGGPESAEGQLFHCHTVTFGDYRLVEGLEAILADIALPLVRPVNRPLLVTAMAWKTLACGGFFLCGFHHKSHIYSLPWN
jgi:hypothetical protein